MVGQNGACKGCYRDTIARDNDISEERRNELADSLRSAVRSELLWLPTLVMVVIQ
jgi:hypothetical protein